MGLLSSIGGAIGLPFVGSTALALAGQGADIWAGRQSAEDQRVYNREEAEANRVFQERMSSTAYQRAVEDMRKAGLNPALAYQQGGASTPSGASATSSPAGTGSASSSLASAVQARRVMAEVDLLKQQARKAGSEADIIEKELPKAEILKDVWQGVAGVYHSAKGVGEYAKSLAKTYPLRPTEKAYRQPLRSLTGAQRESLRKRGSYTRSAR